MTNMPIIHKIIYIILAISAIGSLILLDYYLPENTLGTITGIGTKRMDGDGIISRANPADGPTRDVYFIYTQLPDGDIKVYRNEDTGWRWPFYFKFDSADIQGEAQALSYERKPAIITSYGWRIDMFSKFPNVTDISVAQAGQSLISIRRWIGLVLWAALWGFIGYKTYRWLNRRRVTTHV